MKAPNARCARANSVCSYATSRLVILRDWRLGVLNITLIIAILSYVIIFTVIVQQRYRRLAVDIVGSTRLQLRPPAAAYALPASALPYCGTGHAVGSDGFVYAQAPCRWLDQFDAVSPFLEPSALFVSTRISMANYSSPNASSAACGGASLAPTCGFAPAPDAAETFFVAQIELFTLLIDHTMSSASLHLALAASEMPGRIVDSSDSALNACDDYAQLGLACDPGVKVGQVGIGADVLPLRTLLRAAGAPSLDVLAAGLNETLRYAGTVLVLNIEYGNFRAQTGSWAEDNITYTYRVQLVSAAEFKAEQLSDAQPGVGTAAARTVLNRHGLRILVRQSGTVGTFDSATLLLTLTGGLGLLFLSNLVVDLVATRVLPLRSVYASYKLWQSADASDLGLLSSADLRRHAEEDLVNHQPPFIAEVAERSRSSRVKWALTSREGAAGGAALELPPAAAGAAGGASLNPLRGSA